MAHFARGAASAEAVSFVCWVGRVAVRSAALAACGVDQAVDLAVAALSVGPHLLLA